MLVTESLPRKLEAKRHECIELERVLSEPVVGEEDLEGIRQQLEDTSAEIQQLMEKRMPGSDPMQVRLGGEEEKADIRGQLNDDWSAAYSVLMV